eukprot:TRINITY_DN4397_c0_g1_i3.p1 TRINITY_DN4397_c0_g1~~TRINITY_DN4397_c0_g1_i3.p1  ORF type:complete len:152 (-),score=51.59 TRINITY_DN4397_c0_g1_i3:51-506(-)
MSVHIMTKQQNKDELSRKFEAVSDPNSPEYGQFMTKEQVDALVATDGKIMDSIEEWLNPFKDQIEVTKRADSLTVTATLETLSKIFDTQFKIYKHSPSGKKYTRIAGQAKIPSNLKGGIDMVGGLSDLAVVYGGPVRAPEPLQDPIRPLVH